MDDSRLYCVFTAIRSGLSVLLSVISLIVFICTATYQLINDGDDDNKKVKSKGTV